jgi:diadenosine tetraphosphate (Ap4A) HIT family hydrolase
VLKRHAEALHELSAEEFSELAGLLKKSSSALREVLRCEKEYVACFGEAEHFNHVHVHVIPRAADLPAELKGPRIFELLKVSEDDAVALDEIRVSCEELRHYFTRGTSK